MHPSAFLQPTLNWLLPAQDESVEVIRWSGALEQDKVALSEVVFKERICFANGPEDEHRPVRAQRGRLGAGVRP